MAAFGAVDVSVVFNGVDLSSYVKNVSLKIDGADLDTTGMGTTNNNFHTRIAGLKDWSGSLDLVQDFAASQVNATLVSAVFNQTSGYLLTIKPTSAAVAATNPRLFGNILVNYEPFGSAVGDLAMAKCDFVGAGALTYATT